MRMITQDVLVHSVGVLLVLSLCNLVTTMHRLGIIGNLKEGQNYTYVGDDFPETLPMAELGAVPMVVEDSVHYPISGPGAEEEWLTVYPSGYGFVRLGPERRILCVSMFHQLHCMDKLRRALDNPDDPIATLPHLQHCMNYIRQMVLCSADTTLEPEVFNPRRNASEATGVGVTHTCRNWGAVYAAIEDNYAEWQEYWSEVSAAAEVV